MIGDGMGLSQISVAMYANGGELNLENTTHIRFIKTHSGVSIITDSNYIISETIDFDYAIKQVLDFAKKDKNTLVIINADHEKWWI